MCAISAIPMHSSSMHVTCTCNIQMFIVQQGSIKKDHVKPKKKGKPVSDSSEEDNVEDRGDKSADSEEEEEEVCMYSKRLHKQISRNYYQTYVLSNGLFFTMQDICCYQRAYANSVGVCPISDCTNSLGQSQYGIMPNCLE
jgi:hypothetical protein